MAQEGIERRGYKKELLRFALKPKFLYHVQLWGGVLASTHMFMCFKRVKSIHFFLSLSCIGSTVEKDRGL
jgi:hypothetical protein